LEKARFTCLLAAVLVLSGCSSAGKRRAVAQIPAAAPAIEPLPLASSDHLIRSQPVPAPDAVDLLLAQVEARYQAGMDDYRLGNLEKAKEQFDRAVVLLLQSDLDVQGDDRLHGEFNKLVEDISGAEAAAQERGDTLSPHNYVPAPIESFAGLTFPVDPKVKQQAQEELKSVRSDLPLVSNEYVAGVLTYMQNRGRGYVEAVLKRIGLYRQMISETLAKEGLPQDLIYIAAGESAFNPLAVSRAGAKGIWQFILGRALEYGLKKDRWVDERSDPARSTEAAARHLKDLYQQFGDWFLAMAAYDSGPGVVQTAIEKTGYADYWKLRELHALPRETENYVPVFLAIEMIGKQPKAYGFDVQPESPEATDQVAVGTPTDLRLVAQLIDQPVEELIKLNPSLLRWTTPANDPSFVLSLPAGTKDLFEQNVASIPPDKRIWWRAYKVEGGETVASIAKKFRISAASLAQANQLSRDTPLEMGSRLVLPLAPGKESSLTRVHERGPRRLIHYRVRPGDTLELIADRFEVTPYQIRRWNSMKTSSLAAGKSLRLYVITGGGGGARRARPRRGTGSPATRPAKKMPQPSQPSPAKNKPTPASNPTPPGQAAVR
jgi:membrane-bound lytic murein transglycosylase D